MKSMNFTPSPDTLKQVLSADNSQDIAAGVQRQYDCSAEQAAAVVDVLRIGKNNKKNPTIDAVIRTMIDSMRNGKPLDLWMSQCIGKNPDIRLNDFDYFCKPDAEKPRNVSLPEGVLGDLEAKRWNELKSIQNAINARVLLLLGDQDFFTLDAMDEWASADTLMILQREMKVLSQNVQERAKDFFGKNASVTGWTEFYDKEEFATEFTNATMTKNQWLIDKLKRASIRPYLTSWNYPAIAKNRGIPEEVLMRFIEDGIIRTAAQYRVESRIAMSRGAVQCWAETCGDSLWPINISNYDKKGVPPSIPLL